MVRHTSRHVPRKWRSETFADVGARLPRFIEDAPSWRTLDYVLTIQFEQLFVRLAGRSEATPSVSFRSLLHANIRSRTVSRAWEYHALHCAKPAARDRLLGSNQTDGMPPKQIFGDGDTARTQHEA